MVILLLLVISKIYQPCLGFETIMDDVFTYHNEHRRNWMVPEFTESHTLSEDSKEYAKELVSMKIPDQILYDHVKGKNTPVDQMAFPLSDPDKERYTENICEFKNNICVRYWSVEGAKCYGKSNKSRTKDEESLAEKFSAITWKSSLEIGYGWAAKDPKNKHGRKILVVRYSPPGNQPGEYEDNILNTEFLDYYNLPEVDEPELGSIVRKSEGSQRSALEKEIFITYFVLIVLIL
ncbi:uncharacterized protein LOC108113931 [Drosophila eugracilis]|uniref:uncharacterized protein LOC108113931 n=1 Tax=Drosophila eugracilis TaxID=29029 RepID=UPI0007E7B60D|nr:uncharacterized protein LOC108113931 [Drosophila eugracilis]